MNRAQAVAQVAGHLAAHLQACTFEEATGVRTDADLSEADMDRLSRAVEEITRRLYAMGEGGRS